MKKYYLYHIKGIKIGCSINPNKRIKQQGYTQFEILEEHTDIDIASIREKELQKQYGYRVDDIPYKQSFTMQKSADCSAAGKKGGSISGKVTADLKIGVHNPEKRKEYSQLGIKALYEKYTSAELKQIRSKGSIKRRKLSIEQIEFIKNNWSKSKNQFDRPIGKLSQRTIAKKLGVSLGVVSHACNHYI